MDPMKLPEKAVTETPTWQMTGLLLGHHPMSPSPLVRTDTSCWEDGVFVVSPNAAVNRKKNYAILCDTRRRRGSGIGQKRRKIMDATSLAHDGIGQKRTRIGDVTSPTHNGV